MMSINLENDFAEIRLGDGPIVAVAVHDGHSVRDEVADLLALSDADRRREEDAYTSEWTYIAPTQVVGLRSRFEVDLNRRRHRAVYIHPEDAWGLNVWKHTPDAELIQRSQSLYDSFYETIYQILSDIERRHGWFFVYDLHCYNHRRDGPLAEPSDSADNPQINLCTGGMDLERCEPVVRCFEETIKRFDFLGQTLDVRRNVRFRATRFSRWVHENFPGTGISLGIEVKKFFMDEWTDQVDESQLIEVGRALQSTVLPIQKTLEDLQSESVI